MAYGRAPRGAILSSVNPAEALERLAAPFPLQALEWRVVRLSPDRLSAQVRPQLRLGAVRERLDAVFGAAGWSNAFAGVGEGAIACTLSCQVAGWTLHRSAVAARAPQGDPESTAESAFVYAAEALGMRPPVSPAHRPWVDYNPEAGEILFEPDLATLSDASEASAAPAPPRADAPRVPEAPREKPAGQRAIDRLIDRLRAEGKGRAVAELVVRYGGYGNDPATAREFYAQLRSLLLDRSNPDEAA